ncbi:PA-phosphatase related-family protein [Colletotrichum sp. SAR 10_99]|nr:PA-phosphatase related-family protein [Colletotrichum sp. SAR 10_99]
MPSNDELKKLATEITRDINMSLKQTGSIPDILSSGPWTINYLNQLRLLAYSPHILQKELKPKKGKPFKHIDDYMGEVCMAFDDVIETAGELNLALTAESAANESMKARVAADQEEQTVDIEFQKYWLEEHKKQLEKGEQRLKKAQRDFNKTSKHSELKVLGFKTLSDIQGFFSGTLGAAVNILKESPNIALTGLQAAGNFGNILSGGGGILSGEDRDSNSGHQAARPNAATLTPDPSLQSADEIESQMSRLRNIFEENLLGVLQSGETEELRDCIVQMKEMNARLIGSSYSQLAAGILQDGIKLGEVVLAIQPTAVIIDPEGQEWKKKLRIWHGQIDDIRGPLLRLRAAAASQVGQGFGNTTSSSPSDLNGITMQSLMEMRKNKLLMMETVMKSSQDSVQRITRQNQATQTKMIQLAHRMKQLNYSKGELEDASKVLSEAIDVLFMIKNGFNKIKNNFEFLAKYIDILVSGNTAARLTYAMEAAKDRMSPGDMLCYQIQARTIVDRVLQMRGHFMFIYDMSKLYSEISQSYIMPCIDHMALLKVSKLNTEDRQEKEKACIDEFTTQCSQEIIKIAQKEMETFQREMTARCEEIREDSRLQGLDKLVFRAHPPAHRLFPVTFEDGEAVYPQFAYPAIPQYIPSHAATALGVGVPILVILLCQIRIRSFWDINNGIIGVLYAQLGSAVFQVMIKWLIGGLRPNFLEVCKPDISKASQPGGNATGLDGTGYGGIMYTYDICTTEMGGSLSNALESFPSGHTTSMFAGMVYLYLYLNAKLKVWSNYHPSMWKLILTYAPVLGATLVGGSLTVDQSHNWYDILAGGLIGTMFGFSSYRMVYASIWDWRFNHIPLHRKMPLEYDLDSFDDGLIATRKAGWGKGRGGKPYGTDKTVRTRYSTSRDGRGVGVPPGEMV